MTVSTNQMAPVEQQLLTYKDLKQISDKLMEAVKEELNVSLDNRSEPRIYLQEMLSL